MSVVSSSIGGISLVDKYTKVAREYAKLRQQVQVLKTAVLEERTKRDELTSSSQSTDRQNRKLADEVESLAFRNDQLTRRVEQMQGMLDGGGGEGTASIEGVAPPDTSLLVEELQAKNDENQRLHMQIDAMTRTHQQQMDSQQVALEQSTSGHRPPLPTSVVDSPVSNNPFDEEEEDNNTHAVSIDRRAKSTSTAPSMTSEDRDRLLDTSRVLCKQIVQSHKNYGVYAQQMVEVYGGEGEEEVKTAWSTFGTHCEHLGHSLDAIFSSSPSTADRASSSAELCSTLAQHVMPTYTKFLSTLSSTAPSAELTAAHEAHGHCSTAYLQTLCTSLDMIGRPSLRLEDITKSVAAMVTVCQTLGRSYDQVLRQCRRQGSPLTPAQRSSNECMSACYSSLHRQWRQLGILLADEHNIEVVEAMCHVEERPNNVTPPPPMNDAAAVEVVAEPPVAPTEVLFMREQLERKAAEQCRMQGRIEEQQMELNLIRLKLEKAEQRVGEPTTASTATEDRKIDGPRTDDEYAKEYYADRLKTTQQRMLDLDAAVIYWQNECQTLLRLHAALESETTVANEETSRVQRLLATAEDELNTTRVSYEKQLRALSEHVAELNAKTDVEIRSSNGAVGKTNNNMVCHSSSPSSPDRAEPSFDALQVREAEITVHTVDGTVIRSLIIHFTSL